MKVLKQTHSKIELKQLAETVFGDMLKAVVDVSRELIAVDAELHSDLESLLLEDGSKQQDLWGINFYPTQTGDDFIEFDSMINIRPSQNNFGRGVDSEEIQKKIRSISDKWITK